ncbi:hypothetical protein K474DRAFT_1707354 [Panus rudis PR-1116 ss-1]|nr:hypothetical protein K474DRAFT_1707354 [Panus rudis PR-1116 ss-1]
MDYSSSPREQTHGGHAVTTLPQGAASLSRRNRYSTAPVTFYRDDIVIRDQHWTDNGWRGLRGPPSYPPNASRNNYRGSNSRLGGRNGEVQRILNRLDDVEQQVRESRERLSRTTHRDHTAENSRRRSHSPITRESSSLGGKEKMGIEPSAAGRERIPPWTDHYEICTWLMKDRNRKIYGVRRDECGIPEMDMIKVRGLVKSFAPRARSKDDATKRTPSARFFPIFCALFNHPDTNHYTQRCAELEATICVIHSPRPLPDTAEFSEDAVIKHLADCGFNPTIDQRAKLHQFARQWIEDAEAAETARGHDNDVNLVAH